MFSLKKIFIFYFLFFIDVSILFSQVNSSSKLDNRAVISLDRWNDYLRNDLDSLKIDALDLLQQPFINTNLFAISVAKRSLGSFFIRNGYTSKGRNLLKFSLTFFEKIEDATLESETLSEIGISFFKEKKYYEAKNYFEKSLKCASRSQDETIGFMAELNLAQVYNNLGNKNKSISFAKHYLDKCLYYNKLESASNAYAFLGTMEMNNENLLLAKEYLIHSYELANKSFSKIQLSLAYNNLAVWYANNKQNNKAEDYFIKSLSLRKEVNSPIHIVDSYYNLGENYLLKQEYMNSLKMFRKSLDISRENYLFDSEIDAFNALINTYKMKENYKTALAYSDSLIQRLVFIDKMKSEDYEQIQTILQPIIFKPLSVKDESKKNFIYLELTLLLIAVFILFYFSSRLKSSF